MLPDEDAVEFAGLKAALFEELAPAGALQLVLARRVAVAAWGLARADRMEVEVLEFRSYEGADAGLALMRDANRTRSVETLLRYRNAAMAEFTRALRTVKALQAEARADARTRAAEPAPAPPHRAASRPEIDHRPGPDEPERGADSRLIGAYVRSAPPTSGRALHETPAPWTPNEPEACPEPGDSAPGRPPVLGLEQRAAVRGRSRPNEPESRGNPRDSELVSVQRNPRGA